MWKGYEIIDSRIVECQDPQAPIRVYVNLTDEEKKYLVEVLKIDEHTLTSSLDPDELARLEFEPNHAALIFKRPRNYSAKEQLLFKVASVGSFVFKDALIVVLSEDVPLFDAKTFTRVSTLPGVMLRMIYRSIYHFLEHLKIINLLTDELEKKINTAMENRFLINLFTLEKSLVYYLNSIHSNSVLIEKLKNNAAKLGFNTEEMEFLDDMMIENNQCYRQAEIYSNILASLMDARASIVSNNLNVLMKTLNIIALAMMAPTLVVSIFSMNVPLPFGLGAETNEVSFWLIVVLAALSSVVTYFIWKQSKVKV